MGGGTLLPTIAAIKRAVADEYGLPLAVMSEPDGAAGARLRIRSRPRQVGMTLAVLLTGHSYARIGHFFGGRDHTTVINSCRSVERRRRSDPVLHRAMRRITLELVRQ